MQEHRVITTDEAHPKLTTTTLLRSEVIDLGPRKFMVTSYQAAEDQPIIDLVMELPAKHNTSNTSRRKLRITNWVPKSIVYYALTQSKFVMTVDCVTESAATLHPDKATDTQGKMWGYINNKPHHVSIDHHAVFSAPPDELTSAKLAFELWKKRALFNETRIIVTHTDPDTILTLALIWNLVPINRIVEVISAATAADHTGEDTPLTQLLDFAEVHNDIDLSLSLVQLYFIYQDQLAKQKTTQTWSLQKFSLWLSNNHLMTPKLEDYFSEALTEQDKQTKLAHLFQSKEVTELWNATQNATKKVELATIDGFKLWRYPNNVVLIENTFDPNNPNSMAYDYIESQKLLEVLPPEIQKDVSVVVFSRVMPTVETWELTLQERSNQPVQQPRKRQDQLLYEVKVRVVKPGISLLDLHGFDLTESKKRSNKKRLNWHFGGRPNAGSTFRDGGSTQDGHAFANLISKKLSSFAPDLDARISK